MPDLSHPSLTVIAAPAPVVSRAEAKAHLRVDTDDDDALIDGFVAAATASIDGAMGWLGRALGPQTLALTASHFPGAGCEFDWRFGATCWVAHHVDEIRLPCPPIQAVNNVFYRDPNGATVLLDPSTYALVDRVLFPLGGRSWPTTASRSDAVRVEFVAGYPTGKLPAPIRAAILLMAGSLYNMRDDGPAILTTTSKALLSPYRVSF